MHYFRLLFIFSFVLIISVNSICQADIDELFAEKGEVYFKFENPQTLSLEKLTQIISIDQVTTNNWIYAYANKKEFLKFLDYELDYELLIPPGMLHQPIMKSAVDLKSINDWDFYPTYEAYVDLMYQFEADYPDLCDVFSIGTSIEGRQIMFAKISNNVSTEEGEGRVLYTSSIHGDELTAYVLMLRLMDYLLLNYNSDDQVTTMIDNMEIWINPLANPDGTYASGNNTVQGATRYNANNVDINRNFPDPDPLFGDHPDDNPWQKETIEFMELADSVSFVLSANFHGGAEVFNYPWDTWSQLHADDEWWQFVGHEWADTAQYYSPNGYMDGFDDGITNGYAWYQVHGGRQDYMNFFHHCREVTLEISNVKLLPANQLPDYWEYNYRSFLNYLEQAMFGVQGTITDSITGEPVTAAVFIENHDMENSWVASVSESGNYFRPLYQGAYDIRYTADGYQTKTIYQVNITNKQLTTLDIELVYTGSGIQDITTSGLFKIGPNPNNGKLHLTYLGTEQVDCEVEIFTISGKMTKSARHDFSTGSIDYVIDLSNYKSGLYFVNITSGSFDLNEKIIVR